MEISDLVIRIVVLLLPGLLSISIIIWLIPKRKMDNREFLVYTILLSFLSYTLLYFIKAICPKTDGITFFNALLNSEIPINMHEVLYSSILSVGIAFIITLLINKGLFYNLMRKIRITNKTGAVSVWSEFIDYNGHGMSRYIYVIDIEQDIIYGGEVVNYSNSDSENIELVLQNVIVTKESNRNEIIREMDKIYLKLPNSKIYIEVGDVVNGEENRKKRSKSKSFKAKQ